MEKYGIIFKMLNLHQTRFCFLRFGGKKKKNSTELLLFKG